MSISNNSVAVLTGAASGIGRALAVRHAHEKVAGLAISDVNKKGLEETANLVSRTGVKCTTHLVNVARPEEVRNLADEVLSAHGKATHLINNAGVALFGDFEEISLEDFEWLMNINFWGTVYGVKFFLPILSKQQSAHIINLSSVFGIVAPPGQSAYCASKFAVRGFTESLRHELENTNVFVSTVFPGGIKTNIARSAKLGSGAAIQDKEIGIRFFDKVSINSAEFAAEKILRGIKNKNPRILVGQDAVALNLFQRIFPKRYLQAVERISGMKLHLKKRV
jgi:short-subunit dehydrogenase